MQQAGIRRSVALKAGHYTLCELLDEREDWQEYKAAHCVAHCQADPRSSSAAAASASGASSSSARRRSAVRRNASLTVSLMVARAQAGTGCIQGVVIDIDQPLRHGARMYLSMQRRTCAAGPGLAGQA